MKYTDLRDFIEQLESLCHVVGHTALCGLGQTAPNPVLSTLRYFRDEFEAHIYDKTCPAKTCPDLVKFEVDPEACKRCGLCAKICPNRAIEMVEVSKEYKDKYPKTYPKIDLGKCCFCGLCQDICTKDAIRLTKNFFLSTFDHTKVVKYPTPTACGTVRCGGK